MSTEWAPTGGKIARPASSGTATATVLSYSDYTVGWICALPLELSAAKAMLDCVHPPLPNPANDQNTYTFGKIGVHNIVIGCMPSGVYGMTSATRVASQMRSSFPSLRFGLMVGIGGGAPHPAADIRLGDIVVSKPTGNFGGVVQYDYGKVIEEGVFTRTGYLNKPPEILLTAISTLQADHRMRLSHILEYLSEMALKYPSMASEFASSPQQADQLFNVHYEHAMSESTCDKCDPENLVYRTPRVTNHPVVHYGLIASANQVMKHAPTRDKLARELGILCFEMEAGGLMDNFPCLVIRGVCDYADSHKNKQWQGYAAATAAAYAKELLIVVPAYGNHAVNMVAVSDTRHKPSLFVPFRRDPDFVDRPVLHQILQRASEPGARIGVVGLGGVGKSQLAIEYAYRVHEHNPNIWVLWVHASTATRFEESYRKIATYLRLPGLDAPNADVLGIVHSWLSDESNGRWTMIMDNADDVNVMLEPWDGGANTGAVVASANRSLSEFLPLSFNGSIVITSRSQEALRRLQVYNEDVMEVQPMEVSIAKDLFLKKLKKGGKQHTDEVLRLVTQLDCMPLAISQAAAYIDQCAPRMTVSKYMAILEKNDDDRIMLLEKDIRDPRRDRQASNSIIMTWHITFTHLRQTRNAVARLLALMCMFNQEAIPDSLLRGRYVESPNIGTDFEDDIAILRAYNLVSIGVSDDLFDMHRLVQLSTQKWLEIRQELAEWQERFIDIIGFAFPVVDYANWAILQKLFPHVEVMKTYRVFSARHLLIWANVLHRASDYSWRRGQYIKAENMIRDSLEVRRQTLGQDSPETLASMNMLSLILGEQGKFSEAESMFRQTLASRKKVLGVNHSDTLISVSNLALVLRDQGKYSEAESMSRRALAEREKVLGVDHLHTLTSMSNLASVLADQGKYSEAESMAQRALARREKVLGGDYLDTLTSMNNLASVLADQGKYSEAESMNRRALARREKVLGADHPDTLISVSNLASVLRDQGKYSEAESMSRRVLAGREKVLGADHPSTLTSVNNLALVLGNQGKYSEAESMSRRAVAGSEKVLGADHPSTFTNMHNLAWVLRRRGKYTEAEEMHQRILIGDEKSLGLGHPSTLTSVDNLARVFRDQGKFSEAEEMHRRALSGREKALGLIHPATLTSVDNLARALRDQRKYREAEPIHQRALMGRRKVLGVDHPDTLTSVSNTALLLCDLGKYSESEELQLQALAGREKVLGMNHPDTLTSVDCLAALRTATNNFGEALSLYKRATRGYEKALGAEHPTTIACRRHQEALKDKIEQSRYC